MMIKPYKDIYFERIDKMFLNHKVSSYILIRINNRLTAIKDAREFLILALLLLLTNQYVIATINPIINHQSRYILKEQTVFESLYLWPAQLSFVTKV